MAKPTGASEHRGSIGPRGAHLRPGFGMGGYLPDILPSHHWRLSSLDRDQTFMLEAMRESMRAFGRTSPNPAVGCVVVKADRIVARGFTSPPGGPHAERQAHQALELAPNLREDLQNNGGWPEGADVYVTLEPCSFHGRTPACTDLFQGARNLRVVVGCRDPHPRVAGEGLRLLGSYGLHLELGVLGNEIAATLLPFTRDVISADGKVSEGQSDRPFVALKWAQSIDGAMADHAGKSQWLTGALAGRYTHWLRQKYDALAVGWSTLVADRPLLNVRQVPAGCEPRHPVRVVFDPRDRMSSLSASERVDMFARGGGAASGGGTWVVFGARTVPLLKDASTPSEDGLTDDLELTYLGDSLGTRILWLKVPGDHEHGTWLKDCLAWLASAQGEACLDRRIQSLMVEGGPRLQGIFWSAGLCDALHGWVSPLLLGHSAYTWLGRHQTDLIDARRLRLIQALPVGDDVLCEWVAQE